VQDFTLEYLAEHFEYTSDGKLDNWRIMPQDNLKGDCDDYALTALYILSDHSIVKFWWNLLTFNAILWYTYTPSGEPHLVLQIGDLYIDNGRRKLCTVNQFKSDGYKFVAPFVMPTPAIKMMMAHVVRIQKKIFRKPKSDN
jgi:predicted transglutaminase-like cysteine proteinase